MTYDSNRDRTVPYGSGGGQSGAPETWEWDGTNWEEKQPINSPPTSPREVSMAFDAARNVVVLQSFF